jgi:hypothetical protein
MSRSHLVKWFTYLLGLGFGVGARPSTAGDPPALEAPAEVAFVLQERGTAPAEAAAPHEVIRPPAKDAAPEHFDKAPPRSINERPGVRPPGPNYQWIEGYWDWDKARNDFVWVTGTWRVPPPGRFWVNGYWRRDAKGWFRVPGQWSGRPTQKVDWRKTGPPADRPEEVIGPAPGPDYFYVSGQYIPDEEGVIWRPGFWYRSPPGWEWSPARWVRQSSGWVFREGHWNRDVAAAERQNPRPDIGNPVQGTSVVSYPAGAGPTPDGASNRAPVGVVPVRNGAPPSSREDPDPNGRTAFPLTAEALPGAGLRAGQGNEPEGNSPHSALNSEGGDPVPEAPSVAGNPPNDTSKPGGAGNPTTAGNDTARPNPRYAGPQAPYTPGGYNPYYYPRGYYFGGGLRSVVPMARGFLSRFLP